MFFCSLAFYCDFHLSFLDSNLFHFYQENFDWFLVVLWKRFDFWSLELDTGNFEIKIWNFGDLRFLEFETLQFWNFKLEILKILKFKILRLKAWALKLEILKNWNLEFWESVVWNFEHEIWGLKFFATWNFGDFEFKNWAFRMWYF